jgi:hypothetical protein
MPVNPEALRPEAQQGSSSNQFWDACESTAAQLSVLVNTPEGRHLSTGRTPVIYVAMGAPHPYSPTVNTAGLKFNKRCFGDIYITSVRNPIRQTFSGVTMPSSLYRAAKMITEGAFRVATAEEVLKFHADQETEAKRIMAKERSRLNREVVFAAGA